MKIEIREKGTVPELVDPILVCGLPGSALVGKVAVDHLVQELSAKQLAEVYCDGMAPQVFIQPNGTASMMRNDIYFWKNPGNMHRLKSDLIFFTADSQPVSPESEYSLSASVVEYALKKFRSKEIITLGAYVTGNFSQNPKVYVAATDQFLIKNLVKLGCEVMKEGAITGMNGLILGVAKIMGFRGYALLGETSGYALDPKASESLVVFLEKLIGLKVDLSALEERAKEAQTALNTVEMWRRQQEETGEESSGEEESDEKKRRLDYIS
jgi:uncharacterized protein